MLAGYPVTYRDRTGEVRTTIRNDGGTLSVQLRGVAFRGVGFDALEPCGGDPAVLSTFTLAAGALCGCTLDFVTPLPAEGPGGVQFGTLFAHLELGNPLPNGVVDRELLVLTLALGSDRFTSRGMSGWFEDELLDIQKQLPAGTFMRACINCAFSDYRPVGHGLSGGLACFRDNKDVYLAVQSKSDLFRVWSTRTEFVQETYVCPEFRRRTPGAGYRG